jgi:uncharacterized membrane protein SpoIIM required for sporulation
MVLERLVPLKVALKNPWWMFLIGGIVPIICLLVSFLIFKDSVGLFSTLLITIAMTPFMVNLARYEEEKEEEELPAKPLNIFQRYSDVLKVYTAFFCGMIITFSLLYIVVPENTAKEVLFKNQLEEISAIRGKATAVDTFEKIVVNNVGVLFISFLFSFLFGAGAIFILAWNASILSAAIGELARGIGGFHGLPYAVLVFFPHGSIEILAYFIGGIAGGVISAAITKKHTDKFWLITFDSFKLMLISVVMLLIAGALEVVQLSF